MAKSTPRYVFGFNPEVRFTRSSLMLNEQFTKASSIVALIRDTVYIDGGALSWMPEFADRVGPAVPDSEPILNPKSQIMQKRKKTLEKSG